MTVLEELLQLEERLLRLGPNCDRQVADSLLTPEFTEFGASGRVWTRAAILAELEQTPERTYVITDPICHALSDTSALLTYRLVMAERRSLRSSVWVMRDGHWQMLFHQGTPAAERASSIFAQSNAQNSIPR